MGACSGAAQCRGQLNTGAAHWGDAWRVRAWEGLQEPAWESSHHVKAEVAKGVTCLLTVAWGTGQAPTQGRLHGSHLQGPPPPGQCFHSI